MNDHSEALKQALETMLDEAAAAANEREGAALRDPEEREFSKEHMAQMDRLFQQERNKIRKKKARGYALRAACVLVVLVIVSGISIFSVDAWRVQFLNFVLEVGEPNTDYEFTEDGTISQSGGASYSDEYVTLGYVPDGFELTEVDSSQFSVFLLFEKENQYFTLAIANTNGNFNIDTEDCTIEEISINGIDGVLASKPDVSILIWNNNVDAYTITGNLSKDEMIKIAENVKKN